jgi:hypothetical protein
VGNILVLLIDGAHEGSGRWKYLVHENKNGLFRGQLYPLSDDVDKLAYGEILRTTVSNYSVKELWKTSQRGQDTSSCRLLEYPFDLPSRRSPKRNGELRGQGLKHVEHTYRNAIWVLLADALGLRLPFIERMLILKLGPHSCASRVVEG